MHFEGRSMLLQQAIVLLDKGWVGEQPTQVATAGAMNQIQSCGRLLSEMCCLGGVLP